MFYVVLSVTFHLVYFTVRELSILDETIKLISFIFPFEGSVLCKLCKKFVKILHASCKYYVKL